MSLEMEMLHRYGNIWEVEYQDLLYHVDPHILTGDFLYALPMQNFLQAIQVLVSDL